MRLDVRFHLFFREAHRLWRHLFVRLPRQLRLYPVREINGNVMFRPKRRDAPKNHVIKRYRHDDDGVGTRDDLRPTEYGLTEKDLADIFCFPIHQPDEAKLVPQRLNQAACSIAQAVEDKVLPLQKAEILGKRRRKFLAHRIHPHSPFPRKIRPSYLFCSAMGITLLFLSEQPAQY